jgi:hypothetical protein
LICCAAWPLAAALPAGTQLEIRLLTPVSSFSSKVGNSVSAVLIAPVRTDGQLAIPQGAMVSGTVSNVHKVGLGLIHETARIELEFDQLELPCGEKYPILSRVTAVDNAREHVDKQGNIHAPRVTDSASHRLAYRLASFMMAHPYGLALSLVLDRSLLRFPDPEVSYAPGAEVRIALEEPLTVEDAHEAAPSGPPLSAESLEELQAMVSAMPQWSFTERQGVPMDLTNLVFVGSENAIKRAFLAAGWNGSRPLSKIVGLEAFGALASNQAFTDGPMRPLLVDGVGSDMDWQKSLNTFTKRHHLRVWKRPEQWEGQTVWLSAATWDVNTSFSFRYGPVHRVDPALDVERDKVVNDLVLTGCVDTIVAVPRPGVSGADTGRKDFRTDGAVSAVIFNACEDPLRPEMQTEELRKPGVVTRFVRRVTLTARNHFLRDNMYWRTGEVTVMGARALNHWRQDRAARKRSASLEEVAGQD